MKRFLALVVILLATALLMSSASASITPSTLSATLLPNQSITEQKTVFLPAIIPKGDVMFAIDSTGSMSASIATVKAQAINIMSNVTSLITDVQFGLISFMDYPNNYTSFGYSAQYGDAASGDYAYKLDSALTSNTATVSNAINALTIGWGADGPQDYARIIYESYSDLSIGWRTGAKHILLILGDSVPHYENLNEVVDSYPVPSGWPVGNYSTGGDPGQDEAMFTTDDIILPVALQTMATYPVTLLYVRCHDGAFPDDTNNTMYWTYWTGITGGSAYSISDVSMIPTAIQSMVQAQASHISKLTLKVQEPAYALWLTSVVPSEIDNITVPSTGVNETFNVTITVPPGTAPGTYSFHITADADGADYGEQAVSITVPVVKTPDPSIKLLFQPGAIVEATAAQQPSVDGFITPMWNIRVTGTFSGLARVRIVYPTGGPIPTQILRTDIVLGDVNWDGKVDCKDLLIIIKALGSCPGKPRWNPYCDLNNDKKIDLKDLCIALKNLGKSSVWTPLGGIYVNEAEHYIEGDTDHFSIFGGH